MTYTIQINSKQDASWIKEHFETLFQEEMAKHRDLKGGPTARQNEIG
jgi:hypothetical protein